MISLRSKVLYYVFDSRVFSKGVAEHLRAVGVGQHVHDLAHHVLKLSRRASQLVLLGVATSDFAHHFVFNLNLLLLALFLLVRQVFDTQKLLPGQQARLREVKEFVVWLVEENFILEVHLQVLSVRVLIKESVEESLEVKEADLLLRKRVVNSSLVSRQVIVLFKR